MNKDFMLLCNTIAKNWILSKDNEDKFKFLGIDYTLWPPCAAAAALSEFEISTRLKSRDFAKFMVWDQMEVKDFETNESLPIDADEFKQYYLKLLNNARGEYLSELLKTKPSEYEKIVSDFMKNKLGSGLKIFNLADSIIPTIQNIEKAISEKRSEITLKGFEKLSGMIGGFNPKRISIILARTGLGKTTLSQNLSMSAIRSGYKTIYINMEMGFEDFVSRVLQSELSATGKEMRSLNINRDRIGKLFEELKDKKDFCFTDGRTLSLDEIESVVRIQTEGEQMSLVVVDYDQKVSHGIRDEEWRAMVRVVERLEELSKQTNSHVIMLAQANDSEEVASSKRSKQPASAVLNFIKEKDGILGDKFYLKASKNRFGKTDVCLGLNYNQATGKILEMDLFEQDKIPEKRIF